MTIELTKHEAINLTEFIDESIFSIIRADESIDIIEWLVDIISIYKKLKEATENGYQSL